MSAPSMTFAAILALAIVYVLVPIAANAFMRYRARHTLRCPETGLAADVKIDAARAAITALRGAPELRVAGCSLWPSRAGCAQACVTRR